MDIIITKQLVFQPNYVVALAPIFVLMWGVIGAAISLLKSQQFGVVYDERRLLIRRAFASLVGGIMFSLALGLLS